MAGIILPPIANNEQSFPIRRRSYFTGSDKPKDDRSKGSKRVKSLLFGDYIDCWPTFKNDLKERQSKMDESKKAIDKLFEEGQSILETGKEMSVKQAKFSQSILNFNKAGFSKDEEFILETLTTFGHIFDSISKKAADVMETSKKLIKVHINNYHSCLKDEVESRKKYEENVIMFNKRQNEYLNKTESNTDALKFEDIDKEMDVEREEFHKSSFKYIFQLEKAEQTRKYEFVDMIINRIILRWQSIYIDALKVIDKRNQLIEDLQNKIKASRDKYHITKDGEIQLIARVLAREGSKLKLKPLHEGYLYYVDKQSSSEWVKVYCTYHKKTKVFTIDKPFEKAERQKLAVISCIGKMPTTDCDRRFCFEITGSTTGPPPVTIQALSYQDRREWIEAMEGQQASDENLRIEANKVKQVERMCFLNKEGKHFMRKCMDAIEGSIEEEGIYRVGCTRNNLTDFLLKCLDTEKPDKFNWEDNDLPHYKVLASSMKFYLNHLPVPLLTYELYQAFLDAAKAKESGERIREIHGLISKLPEKHKKALNMLMKHLREVADNSEKNLMNAENLAKVIAPNVLKPEVESKNAKETLDNTKLAYNVVQILIDNYKHIFESKPGRKLSIDTANGHAEQPPPSQPKHGILDNISSMCRKSGRRFSKSKPRKS